MTKQNVHQPTYQSWLHMMKRCYNSKFPDYKYYGARGITVCERWFTYSNFLSDMGERPVDRTLDRRDNSGNYEASNCSWATQSQQNCNRRQWTKRGLTNGQTSV